MNKSFLIGIPIRDLINPMSRLSTVLSGEERIQLSKNLIINLQNSFASIETEIYIISNSPDVEIFCNNNNLKFFRSNKDGLNQEIQYFLKHMSKFKYWTVVHGDLPYITKHFASVWKKLCVEKDIVIAESKDNGTPIFGGSVKFSKFSYGENSYTKHLSILENNSYKFEKVFHKEFYFEIDDESDYKDFLNNPPRWYRKIENF